MISRRGVDTLFASGLLAAICACSSQKPAEPIRNYSMKGEVVRLEPQQQVAVIKHEKIGDWMEPMTMEFPVRDKAEFAKLAPGKRIQATVYVQGIDYWIGGIQQE